MAPNLGIVSEVEHVVLPNAEVLRLGYHAITYRVNGRQLVVPYTLVQAGSVIAIGDRGPLIVPKSAAETLGLDGNGR